MLITTVHMAINVKIFNYKSYVRSVITDYLLWILFGYDKCVAYIVHVYVLVDTRWKLLCSTCVITEHQVFFTECLLMVSL